jgi:hypothetical protein|tara:strand:- start:63 stop:491 length:429 start_codon:yes stop_codon:yes gene_type:complete
VDHEQLEALERLAAAKEAGLLTDTEFEEEKKKILQGNQKAPSPSGDRPEGARPLVEGVSRDAKSLVEGVSRDAKSLVEGMSRDNKRGLVVALGGLVIVIAILLNQQASARDEEINRVRQNARDNADEIWEGILDNIDKAKDG